MYVEGEDAYTYEQAAVILVQIQRRRSRPLHAHTDFISLCRHGGCPVYFEGFLDADCDYGCVCCHCVTCFLMYAGSG